MSEKKHLYTVGLLLDFWRVNVCLYIFVCTMLWFIDPDPNINQMDLCRSAVQRRIGLKYLTWGQLGHSSQDGFIITDIWSVFG